MKSITINGMLKLIIAIILLQTLYFKFKGGPEAVYVFTELGIEPSGRIISGILELIACILLFINKTRFFGACLTMFLMLVALLSHICILGFVVMNDSGVMFALALLTFICSSVLIYRFRNDCNFLGSHNL
nr:DoxX family protein [uncultured Flavobacterium sp.]